MRGFYDSEKEMQKEQAAAAVLYKCRTCKKITLKNFSVHAGRIKGWNNRLLFNSTDASELKMQKQDELKGSKIKYFKKIDDGI